MTTIRVRYHREPEGWWADSPDLGGFVASGRDLAEVRELAKDGVPFYLDDEKVELVEELADSGAPVVEFHVDTEHSVSVSTESQAMSLVCIVGLETSSPKFGPARTGSMYLEAAHVA
jgi:predicted RNase H-like HicB family nuclease